MIFSRRILGNLAVFAIGIAMLLASASGCRTAQEARRTAAARRSYGTPPAATGQVDSLLLIQEKLVEVIDSMTTLVSSDHDRIRSLERQVRAIEAQTGTGTPLPPSDPPSDPTGDPTEAAPPEVPAPASRASVPSPTSFQYSKALRLFRAREYSAALAAFESLEVNDPSGALAGNYRYWQGECYFGEGNYARALRTFESMQSEYSNSPKAPAAAFMRGQCYEHLGDNRHARAAYERVIADYPNSDFSDRARARLRTLQ